MFFCLFSLENGFLLYFVWKKLKSDKTPRYWKMLFAPGLNFREFTPLVSFDALAKSWKVAVYKHTLEFYHIRYCIGNVYFFTRNMWHSLSLDIHAKDLLAIKYFTVSQKGKNTLKGQNFNESFNVAPYITYCYSKHKNSLTSLKYPKLVKYKYCFLLSLALRYYYGL